MASHWRDSWIDGSENTQIWNFTTNDIIFGANDAEVVRFKSDGKVGISESSPVEKLHVAGNVVATGDITAFYSSDERLKKDVIKIDSALDKVTRINGYTFEWNDTKPMQFFNDREAGVIAQEIQEVLPEVVKEREDGYLGVKYDKLVPLLIEAIKELNEKVERLENR